MLLFILLTILYSQNNYKSEQLNPNNYYCKSNFALKILKLSEQDLIFYGTEGGVLRTYDAGESWLQHYTGLNEDDDILKMIYSNKTLLGITYSGKLITSKDKGDFWKTNKISSNLTGITKIDNDIYTTTNKDSIFVSSDNGDTWLKYKTTFSYIQNISSQNDKIVVMTQDIIYILNKDMTIYKELFYPFSFKKLYDKFENLYINDNRKIAKLNNNFEWEVYNTFEDERDFTIYPYDDKISIFTYVKELGKAPSYQQYNFDLKDSKLELVSELNSINLNITISDLWEFKTIDIERINDEFFLSNYYKTIIKVNQNKDWNIISYSCFRSNLSNPKNIENIYMGVSYNSYMIFTKNSGNTFNYTKGPYFLNKVGERLDTIYPYINSALEIDSLKGLIFFDESARIDFKTISNNYNFFGYTDDGFKTIKPLKINLQPPYQAIKTPFRVLGEYQDYIYLTRSFKKLSQNVENPYYTYLYKLNTKTLSFDTIHIFKDSLEVINFYFEDDKIWAIGINIINNTSLKLFLSEDEGKTFELNQTFKLVKKHPMFLPSNAYVTRNKNNDLIAFTDFQIEIINENNYSYSTIELDLTLYPLKYNFSEKYFEDIIFSWNEIKDSVQQDIIYTSYLSFNEKNKLDFNNLYQYNFFDKLIFIPNFTSDDNQIIFHKVSNSQYYFPIEEDRKAYYSSVVNLQPPSFWTFPPYPNPVKDKLKMRFYSAIMSQLSKLKVDLIEISSGRIYQINEFNIVKNDDYYGEIDIDISNYNSGAYLINFKIGEANKSEAIIIE